MKLFNFFLEDDRHQDFKILASREGRAMGSIINELIEDYLKKHMEGNPQHLLDKYTDNEDFIGFPAIALDPINKRKYLKKMPEDMKKQLMFNVQEWLGMLKEK